MNSSFDELNFRCILYNLWLDKHEKVRDFKFVSINFFVFKPNTAIIFRIFFNIISWQVVEVRFRKLSF